MKLDLSNFKKVGKEKNHTVLQSDKGHQIKVAHQGLSKKFIEELENMPVQMAKGGFSEPSKASPQAAYTPPKQAKNAYTEPDNIGTHLVPTGSTVGALSTGEQNPPCMNPSCKSYGRAHPNCRCYGGKLIGMAKGGVASYCASNNAHDKSCEYYKDGGGVHHGVPDTDWAPPTPEAENPAVAAGDYIPKMPVVADTSGNVTESPPQEAASPLDPTQASANQPGVSDVPPESPPIQQEAEPQTQRQQAVPQDHFGDMAHEDANFMADINSGQIKPESYSDFFNKKDTLGKIGTLFGLMVGGLGSGMSGQPNAVMQMMKQELDNDNNAIVSNQTNRKDLLKINQQGLMAKANAKNLDMETAIKADALRRAQKNRLALSSIANEVDKMPEGPDKEKKKLLLAGMASSVQNENFNLFDRARAQAQFINLMKPKTGGGPESAWQDQQFARKMYGGETGQKMADNLEKRHIPYVPGLSSDELSPAEKDHVVSGMDFDRSIGELIDWTKKHPKGTLLDPKAEREGRTLAAIVQGKFREATHGGVYKEGEQNFIGSLINNEPGVLFNKIRVLPQLNVVQKQIRNQMNTYLRAKGFDRYEGPPPQYQGDVSAYGGTNSDNFKSSGDQNQQSSMSKSGREIVYRNGKAYYK